MKRAIIFLILLWVVPGWAKGLMSAKEPVPFPKECDTLHEKVEALYGLRERLRIVHNIYGKWYREGISEVEYNLIPRDMQIVPYADSDLSVEDWERFKVEEFNPRNGWLSSEIPKYRILWKGEVSISTGKTGEELDSEIYNRKQTMKVSDQWQIKVEDIAKE